MRVTVLYNRRKLKRVAAVDVEVYIDRKQRKYISTGVRVEAHQWDASRLKVVKHIQKENLNLQIDNLVNRIDSWYRDCLMNGQQPEISNLMAHLGKGAPSMTLNAYLRAQWQADKGTVAKTTHGKMETVIDRFDKFGTIWITAFDHECLQRYHAYLLTVMQPQSTRNHHKTVDKYIKRAVRQGLIKINPYGDFKKPGTRSRIVYLSTEEINKIREYKGIDRLEKVRDLFLFQCLTGMAYIDMQNLKAEDIRENFIMKPRQKTDRVPQMIPLLPEAQQIIERYSGFSYCFPRISNQKLNAYLQEIANIKGISKKLTTHVGRHTFATVMLEKGLPLETISHILGHASTDTTRVYARILMSKINNDLSRLNIEGI